MQVLTLLERLESASVVHCYHACIAGERYALAADCLLRAETTVRTVM